MSAFGTAFARKWRQAERRAGPLVMAWMRAARCKDRRIFVELYSRD
jgi:hypothetical protein